MNAHDNALWMTGSIAVRAYILAAIPTLPATPERIYAR